MVLSFSFLTRAFSTMVDECLSIHYSSLKFNESFDGLVLLLGIVPTRVSITGTGPKTRGGRRG